MANNINSWRSWVTSRQIFNSDSREWLVKKSNILKLKTLKVLCIQNAADPDNPGYAITGPIQAQSAQVDYFDCAVDQWKGTSYKETSGLKWMVGKIEGMQSKTTHVNRTMSP